jgi:UDP:flavonoid glycosyltransferase YjiC (YdhE family)
VSAPVVAVFAPDAAGHFGPLRAVIAGLHERGAAVHVFTGRTFAAQAEAAGGRFVDLFGRYPPEAADDESIPVVSRYVTFAAHYAEPIIRDLAALRPSLVVYDTLAVIGRVVALALGVPYVNVSAGHNTAPGPYLEALATDPRVATSERCLRAVEVLRERFGIADASPFSYIDGLSPHLNLLCEPPQWLSEDERRVFEPAAFFGSLAPARELEAPRPAAGFRGGSPKVYAALGTVPWWYWPELVSATLQTVAQALGATADVLISTGGSSIPAADVAAMRRAGAQVVPRLHTWAALGEADAFVTSQGANSTHEAVFSRVPMLSYPFFADQPELTERCARFGLALPLVDEPRAPLDPERLRAALAEVVERRRQFGDALERARAWELAVVDGRGAVIERLLGLAQE